MSFPPRQGRRRRLRRTPSLMVLVPMVLVAVGGYSYWRDTRFPARSEQLRGTPVELRIQDGVKRKELRAIRDGLVLGHRFMARTLGRTVHDAVEARIARANRCHPFQSSGALIGEADDDFLCIDTAALSWQWLMQKDVLAATSISAHEYVHVLQAELGCLSQNGGQRYRWLIEGMADEIAWSALVVAGRATEARVEREIRGDGAFSPGLEPLRAYERSDGRDREYALWHLAVRQLLREAVAARAAPRARPERSLVRFCERVGRGASWRDAFARSFGVRVNEFYADFAAVRRRGTSMAASRASAKPGSSRRSAGARIADRRRRSE